MAVLRLSLPDLILEGLAVSRADCAFFEVKEQRLHPIPFLSEDSFPSSSHWCRGDTQL